MFYHWARFDIIQLYLKHTQREIYPSGNNFTQALLVMLVTNIIFGIGGDGWMVGFLFFT